MIPEDIPVYDLNKKNRFSIFKLIILLAYKIFPKIKPDIVISFLTYANLVTLIARKISFFKPFILISERNYKLLYWKEKKARISRLKRSLTGFVYSRANQIISLSKGVADYMIKSFEVPEHKIKVIYNGVDMNLIKRMAREPLRESFLADHSTPIFSACGRMVYQKNFTLLLEAFSLINNKIDSRLLILGEGEEKNLLEDLVAKLGIQGKTFFLGFKRNPYKYIAASDIFILSSRWEGFGNVIIEAMSCEVPVVATKCFGSEEIITNGVNGILVQNEKPEKMANAIIRLTKDKDLSNRLIDGGKKRIMDFTMEKMISEYERVFLKNIEY
jgi:glycosyltransferase involved in cell wall biosynthesis